MTQEELELIAELCRKHDVIVVSDEVYEWLVYPPQKHIRIGQYTSLYEWFLTSYRYFIRLSIFLQVLMSQKRVF